MTICVAGTHKLAQTATKELRGGKEGLWFKCVVYSFSFFFLPPFLFLLFSLFLSSEIPGQWSSDMHGEVRAARPAHGCNSLATPFLGIRVQPKRHARGDRCTHLCAGRCARGGGWVHRDTRGYVHHRNAHRYPDTARCPQGGGCTRTPARTCARGVARSRLGVGRRVHGNG
ncbi:hypothetical protein B0H13DRAFT_874648 [Mycena leptocephala]|nr:hypothetical protein B0H13DRAFT_874648 [Mycena leptocephala]